MYRKNTCLIEYLTNFRILRIYRKRISLSWKISAMSWKISEFKVTEFLSIYIIIAILYTCRKSVSTYLKCT